MKLTGMLLFVLVLVAATPALATGFEACQTACSPPAGNIVLGAKPPYDAAVKFSAAVKEKNGVTFWQWVRVGDPSKPCTSAQLTGADPNDPKACRAKVGEVLLQTMPVKPKAPKK